MSEIKQDTKIDKQISGELSKQRLSIRKHPIIHIFFGGLLCLLMVSFGVYVILSRELLLWIGSSIYWSLSTLAIIIPMSTILVGWISHSLEYMDITDDRIEHFQMYMGLSQNTTTCDIESIQEIRSQTSGISQILLGYGTIQIYTTNNILHIEMSHVANPAETIEQINSIIRSKKT